jgi:hypothetical protein
MRDYRDVHRAALLRDEEQRLAALGNDRESEWVHPENDDPDMLGADEVPVRHTQKVAGGGGCIFQEQLVLEVAFERALAERVQGGQDADAS